MFDRDEPVGVRRRVAGLKFSAVIERRLGPPEYVAGLRLESLGATGRETGRERVGRTILAQFERDLPTVRLVRSDSTTVGDGIAEL